MPVDIAELMGKVYTAKEAGDVLGLTPDSIRRLVREGHLRAVNVPGQRKYRFKGEDIARYVQGEPPVRDSKSK